jgi:hypothetical protein
LSRAVRRAAPIVLPLLLLAGCGNKPSKAPVRTQAAAPGKFVSQALPDQDLYFSRPAAWHYTPGTPPLLGTVSSGLVTIAIWRYPRSEALPTTPSELGVARNALVSAAKARDPTFKVVQAKGTRAAHHPAVVIVADESVGGQPRRVRSTHVYGAHSEYVIDAFAPPDQYPKVEDPVFRTLVRSMRIAAPTG